MKKIFLLLLIIIPYILFSQVRVKGYYRKDGTYVQPHYRSNPDGNVYNNWSTKGNINPYTGKEGTKNPTTSNSNSIRSSYNSSETNDNSSVNMHNVNEKEGENNKTVQNNINSQSNYNSRISVIYFDKIGYSFEEEFSVKNNTGKDISSLSIRIIYKLENGEIIDFKDYILQEKIPNGLSKKFTQKSFDQKQSFAYKYGNTSYKPNYTLFTVDFQILNYK